MTYRSMAQCVADLDKHGHLVRVSEELDPRLEIAEIQRRVYASGGPAVLFEQVKGCRFPMVSNLFGSLDRARWIFRSTIDQVRRAIEIKIDPASAMKKPLRYWRAPLTAWRMQPRYVRSGAVLKNECKVSDLPQLMSWPMDGGSFVTLPLVYTESLRKPGWPGSNLGMYRVQLAGNEYEPDREIGLHYQVHRGIGVHHQEALAERRPLRVAIFVGGTPAMTVSAVMPLPEGMPELTFAGALAGHRIPMVKRKGHVSLYADADFVIVGSVDPGATKPEGPFGDHLGYYSLTHEFPLMKVERVWHRDGAIWPFTVVGRPPQEDTTFGQLIHELTGPVIPTVIPGVRNVHAVDASGVHPLLLAVGSERYVPFASQDRPMEILTQANAILGQGQMSLAKYLLICNGNDDPSLDAHHIDHFFDHWLRRVDWTNDVHFQTRTTIDTLDYSGESLNAGSKVVMAARGQARFELATSLEGMSSLPDGFGEPKICRPGVVAIEGPRCAQASDRSELRRFCQSIEAGHPLRRFRLIVLVDDASFTAATLNNWLWVSFTRSNPALDIDGVDASTIDKHWGCAGPLVIDARIKPHHAPPLVEDPQVTKRVDALAARGGPLARWL